MHESNNNNKINSVALVTTLSSVENRFSIREPNRILLEFFPREPKRSTNREFENRSTIIILRVNKITCSEFKIQILKMFHVFLNENYFRRSNLVVFLFKNDVRYSKW